MPSESQLPSGTSGSTGAKKGVHDFLYHDARRIGAFLAQRNPYGLIQSLSRGTESGDSKASSKSIEGGVKVFGIANIGGSGEGSEESSSSESSSQTYDPFWVNALQFFASLEEEGLLKDNVESAEIGQFISCEGSLMVFDTSFMQRVYQHESTRNLTLRRQNMNPETGQPFTKEEIDLECDALGEVPPHVQIHLYSTNNNVIWGGIRPEGLVTPPNEITMKHGVEVDGTWTVIGIKDADPIADITNYGNRLSALKSRYMDYKFLLEAIEINTRLRFWLGRPHYCHGVTPLAIFRTVGGG